MKNKNLKGFTLIEILVVIAIIGIFSVVVFVSLGNSKNKANDAKIKSQLKSMFNQASLFSGLTGSTYAYVVPAGTLPLAPNVTGAAPGGGTTGTLFNDTDSSSNSLYPLLSKMPSGSFIYYGWDGNHPASGGLWFVVVGTSSGAVCVDYSGFMRTWTGTFSNSPQKSEVIAAGVFPNARVYPNGNYTCQP